MDNILNLCRQKGYVPAPDAEAATLIDRFHPDFKSSPLGTVLLRILAFDLQHQQFAIGQPDQKIRNKAVPDAIPEIPDLIWEEIIFPTD